MTAKLAKAFSINLLSGRTKVLIKSTQSFSEVQALLGEGTAHTARKKILAFLWLDRKTQSRTRVEDELGYQVRSRLQNFWLNLLSNLLMQAVILQRMQPVVSPRV